MSTPATPIWEVFIRSRSGLAHRHVGSVHAADATLALQAARDVYTRRGEGLSMRDRFRGRSVFRWVYRCGEQIIACHGNRLAVDVAGPNKKARTGNNSGAGWDFLGEVPESLPFEIV